MVAAPIRHIISTKKVALLGAILFYDDISLARETFKKKQICIILKQKYMVYFFTQCYNNNVERDRAR